MAEKFFDAGPADALRAGTMRCVEIGARRVLIANVEGRYYATDDRCTHEDASLSSGVLKGALVRCPLHGSRFDLRTGAALEEPAEENLRSYAVRVEGGRLLVACPEGTQA
ncbi:MAG TPA: non-heme iron oxygenase ferredoxin subunit [Burkholderiales bacterium]|nr:non-heme iron oxygenase ferredoxin subunit [Burkholderiales bacterium]